LFISTEAPQVFWSLNALPSTLAVEQRGAGRAGRAEVARGRQDRAHGADAAVLVGARVVDCGVEVEAVVRAPDQLAAQAVRIQTVVLLTVELVGDDALGFIVESGNPSGQLAALDRDRDRTLGPHLVEGRVAERGVGLELAQVRAGGDDVDHPGRRVLAEQHALRAAQHFDPLDVVEVEERAGAAADDDAVQNHRHGRLDAVREVERAEAAHRQALAAGVGRGREGQRRRQLLQLLQARDVAVGQRLGGDDVDRHRHVLQALGALLGGDHQFAEGELFFLGGGGAGRAEHGDGGRAGQQGVPGERGRPREGSVEHASPNLLRANSGGVTSRPRAFGAPAFTRRRFLRQSELCQL
jgi:hypothetical protein